MKTSTNMSESFKPTLLDQLREKADALRASDQAARKPMEASIKDIDRCLWRVFRWLDEAIGHLEVIRPRVMHVFSLHNILAIERPRFDGGFVSFRRRGMVGMEVLEHLELFYRLEGPTPIVLRLNPAEAVGVEEKLRTSTLPYQYQTEQDDRRVIRHGVFQVQPAITASVRFEPNFRRQVIAVTLRNVDRFESVALEFTQDNMNEAALEDMVKFMMGDPNTFLRRAPLALIRGRRDDEPVPAPVNASAARAG